MSFLSDIFGKKPKVPELPAIDFNKEIINTIEGNTAALPNAQRLGAGINTFNQSELDRMYESALPGYDRIKGNVGRNLSSLTAGQIPQDVQDAVLRNAAFRSYRGGFAGSGMSRNLSGRDLGLASLDMIGRGMDSTQRWLSFAASPRFDITSMFLTPSQRIPMVMQERDSQFQHQYLKNQIKAMPDPVTRGWTDAVTTLLMGAGNMWGAGYETSSPNEFGRTDTPQANIGGGGSYMPYQNSYGSNPYVSNPGQYGQPADYEDAAYGSGGGGGGGGGGSNTSSMAAFSAMGF